MVSSLQFGVYLYETDQDANEVGIAGLSGYLPKGERMREARHADSRKEMGEMKVFLAHGMKDQMVPKFVFRETKRRVGQMVAEAVLESHEYQDLAHSTSGAELRDMCTFLEKILPG